MYLHSLSQNMQKIATIGLNYSITGKATLCSHIEIKWSLHQGIHNYVFNIKIFKNFQCIYGIS